MRTFSTILLSLLLILPVFSQVQSKVQLAVFDFAGKGVSQNEAELLSDRFRGELVNTNAFIVIERSIMNDILSESNLSLAGCTETSCAIEAGKLLNVRKVITGTIGKIGSTYSINVRLIDIESSQIERFFSKDFVGEIEGFLLILKDIANQIAGKKQIAPVEIQDNKKQSYQNKTSDLSKKSIQPKKQKRFSVGLGYLISNPPQNQYAALGVRLCCYIKHITLSLFVGRSDSFSDDLVEGIDYAKLGTEGMTVSEFSFEYIFSPNRSISFFSGIGLIYSNPRIIFYRYVDNYWNYEEQEQRTNFGIHPRLGICTYRYSKISSNLSIGYIFNKDIIPLDPETSAAGSSLMEPIKYSGVSIDFSLMINF